MNSHHVIELLLKVADDSLCICSDCILSALVYHVFEICLLHIMNMQLTPVRMHCIVDRENPSVVG
jgi:hypothetical protein